MVRHNESTAAEYTAVVLDAAPSLAGDDTRLVVTADTIPRIPSPAVVVADGWGEVYYLQAAGRAADLPAPGDLAEWLDFVRHQCPECQGEAR